MAVRAKVAKPSRVQKPKIVEQRLLLHNVSWKAYETIGEVLDERPALRLTYDRGTLEIMKTSSPPAPNAWTSDTQRITFWDIDWKDYETLLEVLDGHHLRLTYDRGTLEIMTLSPEHERYKHLLRRLVEVLSEEFNIEMEGYGSTTYRRQDAQRGLEPDECYYFHNRERVRGKTRIDLKTDPAPDLGIEIDITHGSEDRLVIYATLKVPEVWRFNGKKIQVLLLNDAGQYVPSSTSKLIPSFRLNDLLPFIRQGLKEGEMPMVRAFRAWLRDQIAAKKEKKKDKQ